MSGHVPVMLAEVLTALAPQAGGVYIDGTFGGGGYSKAILSGRDCSVLGIDRDPAAKGLESGPVVVAGEDDGAE